MNQAHTVEEYHRITQPRMWTEGGRTRVEFHAETEWAASSLIGIMGTFHYLISLFLKGTVPFAHGCSANLGITGTGSARLHGLKSWLSQRQLLRFIWKQTNLAALSERLVVSWHTEQRLVLCQPIQAERSGVSAVDLLPLWLMFIHRIL